MAALPRDVSLLRAFCSFGVVLAALVCAFQLQPALAYLRLARGSAAPAGQRAQLVSIAAGFAGSTFALAPSRASPCSA